MISSLTFTRFTYRNMVQKFMNTSTIFDNTVSASIFARLLIKRLPYSIANTLHDCFNINSYIRHSRLWINFALNKLQKKIVFSVCNAGINFTVE